MHNHGRRALAVVAVAAGVLLAGCSGSDDATGDATGDETGGGDARTSIELPDQLGTLTTLEAQCDAAGDRAELCLTNADDSARVDQAAADNLSAVHEDAVATGQTYADDGYDHIVRVFAVAGSSTELWTVESEASAERATLGHPIEWVEERDGAQCLLHTLTPVREGETLSPDNVLVERCQATDADLTVLVLPGGDASLDDAFAWTGEAYDAIS